MSMKEAYERKLQAQLNEWNAEIDKLKARAERAEANSQIEYHKQIEELRQQQQAAQVKLSELRQSGEDGWKDLKVGMESAWDNLGKAVRSAASRFE